MRRLMRPSDERIIFGSTRKIRKDTGWKPMKSIEQTLEIHVGILGRTYCDVEKPRVRLLAKSEVNYGFTVNLKQNISPRLDYFARRYDRLYCSSAEWGHACKRSCRLRRSHWPGLGDMPFLELLVLQLRSQGIRRIVMCTGHLAEPDRARIRRRPEMGRCD